MPKINFFVRTKLSHKAMLVGSNSMQPICSAPVLALSYKSIVILLHPLAARL